MIHCYSHRDCAARLSSVGLVMALLLVAPNAIGAWGSAPPEIWDSHSTVPDTDQLASLSHVRFSVIKRYEFQQDGYRFLHGVALAWHRGQLFASFGHNRGGENTDSEEAHFRISNDAGATWGPVLTIDAGDEPDLGVSHGVFLDFQDQLWAFHGAYSGTLQHVHTRAYAWDDSNAKWTSLGTVVDSGFWPMQAPQPTADGNWIMSGIRVGEGNPPAVAISEGANLLKWKLVVLPMPAELGRLWGESSVIEQGHRILNVSRYGEHARALVCRSEDCGRSWTPIQVSNLPMATSKPYAGVLSNGQYYLIGTTTGDGGGRRSPLTIAVTRPGEFVFRKISIIRRALFPTGPGESDAHASLAYPYAVEHYGQLFVGYSNNGGNRGRIGTGRQLWNNNSAELAVIPIAQLRVDVPDQPAKKK